MKKLILLTLITFSLQAGDIAPYSNNTNQSFLKSNQSVANQIISSNLKDLNMIMKKKAADKGYFKVGAATLGAGTIALAAKTPIAQETFS